MLHPISTKEPELCQDVFAQTAALVSGICVGRSAEPVWNTDGHTTSCLSMPQNGRMTEHSVLPAQHVIAAADAEKRPCHNATREGRRPSFSSGGLPNAFRGPAVTGNAPAASLTSVVVLRRSGNYRLAPASFKYASTRGPKAFGSGSCIWASKSSYLLEAISG